jgi:hypothetical protein
MVVNKAESNFIKQWEKIGRAPRTLYLLSDRPAWATQTLGIDQREQFLVE